MPCRGRKESTPPPRQFSGRGRARILLEDHTGEAEIVVPPKTYERCRSFLRSWPTRDEIRPLEPDREEHDDGR